METLGKQLQDYGPMQTLWVKGTSSIIYRDAKDVTNSLLPFPLKGYRSLRSCLGP